MEANNRINRRSRPRPYDLRRKVLLKNFLREQMTYLPQTPLTSSVQDSHVDFEENSSDASEREEDLQELNDENSSITIAPMNAQTNITSNTESDARDFETNSTENCSSPQTEGELPVKIISVSVSKNKSKISRFSSLMNLRSKSKKKAIKGIIKAKKVCKNTKSPVKSKILKASLERTLSDQTSNEKSCKTPKSSFKSFISLLKTRRARRKRSDVDRQTSVDTKPCESIGSNAVEDTDQMSFDQCKEELTKAKELTKLLQEENRLLTQSLSYFLSNSSINSPSVPLQDSNQNISNMKRFTTNDHESSVLADYDWDHQPRILRSKSVHEHSNHKPIPRSTQRTKSMSCHIIRNNLSRGSAPAVGYNGGSKRLNISHVRQTDNLSVNRSNRVVQRRFSMPERFLSENEGSRTSNALSFFRNRHRTRSMSCHDSQSNFLNSVFNGESGENSIPRAKQKNILSNLPVDIAGRVVQRRSSMPDRTLSVHNKPRRCHRSGSVRESCSRTPFHSLPPSAFY